GIKMPLVCAQLYDAILQHGDGEDPDGLGALIERTNAQVGGSPKNGISEEKWLAAFLKVRRSDLAYSYNPETGKEWAGSVSRVDVFVDLLAAKNLSLKGPICITRGDFKGIVVDPRRGRRDHPQGLRSCSAAAASTGGQGSVCRWSLHGRGHGSGARSVRNCRGGRKEQRSAGEPARDADRQLCEDHAGALLYARALHGRR